MELDETDTKILNILQQNSRTANAEIARRLGMAPSAILERIRKLEERDVIRQYTALLNGKSVGQGVLAFIFVRTDDRVGQVRTAQALAQIPEILEVHYIAGEDCYLVKVRVGDTESLSKLFTERLAHIKSITSTRTTIVLETVKESTALPLKLEEDTKSKGRRSG